jgi:4'-phosphopantetheinyl transferase EntD
MLIDFNIHGVSAFGAPLPFDSQLEKSFSSWLPDGMKNVAQTRQQEFIAGRYCAFKASKEVGYDLSQLPAAPTREPVWPEGILGSITHSKQMAISCVSVSDEISSIGIDAEELMKIGLAQEIERVIATEEELLMIAGADYQMGITILFSAKEALYKALFPLARTFIDFKEVKLTKLHSDKRLFELELKSSNPKLKGYLGRYEGSFKLIGETVVTVVSIPKVVSKELYVHS